MLAIPHNAGGASRPDTPTLSTLVAGWREFEVLAGRLQGAIDGTVRYTMPQDQRQWRWRWQLSQREGCKLLEEQEFQPAREKVVKCYNRDYNFELLGGPAWKLVDIDRSGNYTNSRVDQLNRVVFAALREPVELQQGGPLSMLMHESIFVVESLAPAEDGEVRMKLANTEGWRKDNPRSALADADILLTHDKFHVIRSYASNLQIGKRRQYVKIAMEYKYDLDGTPIPVSGTSELREPPEGPVVMTTHYKYDLTVPKDLPAEASFRLSAFGMSETLASRRPSGTQWPIIASVVAVLALVLIAKGLSNKRR